MASGAVGECCPRFNPGPWEEKELEWKDRKFVKDRVRSFLHMPLNFGTVLRRNRSLIEAAGAAPEEMFARDRVMRISKELAQTEIRTAGLNREAYEMPILFFSFAYLAGLLLVFYWRKTRTLKPV